MTVDINQFWNLLSESKLLQPSQLQKLQADFSSAGQEPTAKAVSNWLIGRQALSPYQCTIILAGHSGPFQYGNYTLVDRFDKGQLKASFKAKHATSQHPVLLEFLSGDRNEDLLVWRRIESVAEKAAAIEHPNLISVFESVVLPNHRFVVSELPGGAPLSSKLPRKGRIPWENACLLFAQTAAGLGQLHQNGIVHGAISPRAIWLEKGIWARIKQNFQTDAEFKRSPEQKEAESKFDYLPPEWSEVDYEETREGDLYSLGCSLYRAVTGRPLFVGKTDKEKRTRHQSDALPDLTRYDLPDPLVQLLKRMLAKCPSQRSTDAVSIQKLLTDLSGTPDTLRKIEIPELPTLKTYRKSLNQFRPGTEPFVEQVPEIEAEDYRTAFANLDVGHSVKPVTPDHAERIKAATLAALKRKQNRWKIPAAMFGSLLAFSIAITIWAIQANRTIVTQYQSKIDNGIHIASNLESASGESEIESSPTEGKIDFAALPDSERPILMQELVPDDNETLWETPTSGAPVDLSGLPVAPKIIFLLRPREIAQSPEGQRAIRALGPEFRSLVDNWIEQSGLELEAISELVVSLHSTEEFQYRPYFVFTVEQPWELDRLEQIWNRPIVETTESGIRFYSSSTEDRGFLLLENEDSNPDRVTRFAMGSVDAIKEVASNAGATPLSGSIRKMKDWTDRDRHLNVLYLRNALFNDEGQSLMGSRLMGVNRELSVLIPDNVRGGLFSLHFDQGGTFLELMFDRSVDLKADSLTETLSNRIREQHDVLTQWVASFPVAPYWDRVRFKYDNMLADVLRNLRWGIEHDEVTANCWLPPMAAHNLIAASELVLSFSDNASQSPRMQVVSVPQTIEKLLAVKRDLKITNPPDLNLLMADIEAEVNEDFRGLPFKFRIRLLGSDLEKEGITKNQRPSELDIEQKTLAEILTEIMMAANPDKDISGPADPRCKLVWVIAPDVESAGEQAVLITTRAAAAEKSYTLPDIFKTE